jgi:hypothetical protein
MRMRDELWACLQAELVKLDVTEEACRTRFTVESYIKAAKTFSETRLKILAMMERLATDSPPEGQAKTAWDKVNSDEGL